jgi:glycosyltransferase involved in cell wall biosynthesis
VLEAMHLGVPVVVRQGTAAVEVGGNAVLAFSTADEAAGQLHKVLNDQGVRDELVKLGRERASAMIRQASVDIWIPLLERL